MLFSVKDVCYLFNSLKTRLCGLIVRVRVVPRRTVVGDIDRRFDNLSGSHHQSHGSDDVLLGTTLTQTTQTTETPGFKPFTIFKDCKCLKVELDDQFLFKF